MLVVSETEKSVVVLHLHIGSLKTLSELESIPTSLQADYLATVPSRRILKRVLHMGPTYIHIVRNW